jgi:hypothetical protein
VVSEREQIADASPLPLGTLAVGMGVLAVIFIGSAIVLTVRRRRRERW